MVGLYLPERAKETSVQVPPATQVELLSEEGWLATTPPSWWGWTSLDESLTFLPPFCQVEEQETWQ